MAKQKSTAYDDDFSGLASRHGIASPKASAYRSGRLFLRQRAIVLARLQPITGRILDLACGVGATSLPLIEEGLPVFGVDFNAAACIGAQQAGIKVCRSGATVLPLAEHSFGVVLVSELLQYLSDADIEAMVAECARVIAPRGRIFIIWRNGDSLVHLIARPLYRFVDGVLRGRKGVHLRTPSPGAVADAARRSGLGVDSVETFSAITGQTFRDVTSLLSRCLGTTFLVVLSKP